MGIIIFIFGTMCAIQEAHSSLPSLAEIKLRSRWCLGEGAHCPVNLPFKISSCCKPYVCTAIPKTRKPSLIMRFKDYKDHRCILPATDLRSGTINGSILEYDNFNTTESEFQNHESITSEIASVVDENVEASTVTFDENETNTNTSLDNLSEYEEDGSSLTASNETYSDDNERNSSHIVKRSISNYSSENNQSWSSENSYSSTEHNDHYGNNSLESEMSSLENNNFTISSDSESVKLNSEMSKETNFSYYNYAGNATALQTNSSTSSSQLFSDLIQNNASLDNNSTITGSYYKTNTLSITTVLPTELTNSSEEDWSSSQMDYDTRPGLHKVVTIHPFRLFQSVELIRLNESVETSD